MWYKDGTEFKSVNGYDVDGAWYPRVTKILEIKSKPALDVFFKEMGSYASAEEVKNKSAQEGTLMHEAVQQLLVGEEKEISQEVRPGVAAFQIFNEERKIVFHPEFVERRIWSNRHKYAGTLDALAWVDGKFGVLDIKTSTGFYPEYNLQTAAYVTALQEFEVKRMLALPRDIETRWILRIDQHRICGRCKATLREKGGRAKIRSKSATRAVCTDANHEWGEREGDVELKEFPFVYKDMKAFVAAKILWEWENDYWLKKIGYVK
ncbi:MAG: hypothetical protein HY006_00935 [Candidatus Sungbacteria bacterium]|nr:hypothetical protein [Candidatus Sungbacteria bacterium]